MFHMEFILIDSSDVPQRCGSKRRLHQGVVDMQNPGPLIINARAPVSISILEFMTVIMHTMTMGLSTDTSDISLL
jgi:hypothetical protein